jgi:hypothetical protein
MIGWLLHDHYCTLGTGLNRRGANVGVALGASCTRVGWRGSQVDREHRDESDRPSPGHDDYVTHDIAGKEVCLTRHEPFWRFHAPPIARRQGRQQQSALSGGASPFSGQHRSAKVHFAGRPGVALASPSFRLARASSDGLLNLRFGFGADDFPAGYVWQFRMKESTYGRTGSTTREHSRSASRWRQQRGTCQRC